jgi:hypothetical protein
MKKIKLNKQLEIDIKDYLVHPDGAIMQKFPMQNMPMADFHNFGSPWKNINSIKITEVTPISIIDSPVTKTLYLSLMETSAPLIVWTGKYYDEAGEWTEEQVYKAAEEILNSSNDQFFISLIDRRMAMQYLRFVTQKIRSENADSPALKTLLNSVPVLKVAVLPDFSE